MDIYYAIWAMMIKWSLVSRAAVVMLVVFFLIYIFTPLILKLLGFLLYILDYILKGIYCLLCFIIQFFYYVGMKEWVVNATNRLSYLMEAISKKIRKTAGQISKNKRGKIRKYIVIYLICIFLIWLPDIVKGVVDPRYTNAFAAVNNLYQIFEKNTVQKAGRYEPLIQMPKKDLKKEKEKIKADETGTSINEEIWLSLVGEGVFGANIRTGRGKEYESIAVVKGEEKLLYLEKEDGWVKVKTEDDLEGWINEKIVSGIVE